MSKVDTEEVYLANLYIGVCVLYVSVGVCYIYGYMCTMYISVCVYYVGMSVLNNAYIQNNI